MSKKTLIARTNDVIGLVKQITTMPHAYMVGMMEGLLIAHHREVYEDLLNRMEQSCREKIENNDAA